MACTTASLESTAAPQRGERGERLGLAGADPAGEGRRRGRAVGAPLGRQAASGSSAPRAGAASSRRLLGDRLLGGRLVGDRPPRGPPRRRPPRPAPRDGSSDGLLDDGLGDGLLRRQRPRRRPRRRPPRPAPRRRPPRRPPRPAASTTTSSAASSTASSAVASSAASARAGVVVRASSSAITAPADLVGQVVLDRVAVGHALEAQREPAPVGVDLDDPHGEHVALVDHLARVLHVVRGQLGDVDQALDAGVDLDEGAERDDLGDLALDHVVHLVALDDALPRVGLGLLEAQGDPLAVAVDVEHLDLDLLADRRAPRRGG